MKRKVYASRGEKQVDFAIGFVIGAAFVIGAPVLLAVLFPERPDLGWVVPTLAVGFLIVAGLYRPWMALGGLGCLATLIGLGLLAAMFLAVVCSTAFR